jgi:hypothetical protein
VARLPHALTTLAALPAMPAQVMAFVWLADAAQRDRPPTPSVRLTSPEGAPCLAQVKLFAPCAVCVSARWSSAPRSSLLARRRTLQQVPSPPRSSSSRRIRTALSHGGGAADRPVPSSSTTARPQRTAIGAHRAEREQRERFFDDDNVPALDFAGAEIYPRSVSRRRDGTNARGRFTQETAAESDKVLLSRKLTNAALCRRRAA